jgi:hypothetical protein
MKQQGAEGVRRTITHQPFVAILPGESLIEYVDLVDGLAAELLPEGFLQWDALHTIAKSMWWKQRRQHFTAATMTTAMFDPDQRAYDEALVLNGLYHTLLGETGEREIEQTLGRLAKDLRDYLLSQCPRGKSRTSKAWARAMRKTIEKVLLPAATRFGELPAEVLMGRSAATVTDEMFMRDLEIEERLDTLIDRAFARFFRLKAIEYQITFTELRRWDRNATDRTNASATRSSTGGARA